VTRGALIVVLLLVAGCRVDGAVRDLSPPHQRAQPEPDLEAMRRCGLPQCRSANDCPSAEICEGGLCVRDPAVPAIDPKRAQ
jgi:hypothetical protein